jgi:hypothetical protein
MLKKMDSPRTDLVNKKTLNSRQPWIKHNNGKRNMSRLKRYKTLNFQNPTISEMLMDLTLPAISEIKATVDHATLSPSLKSWRLG